MQQDNKMGSQVKARDGVIPFGGVVPDMVMIDRTQAQMFTALGRTRSPFHGVAAWPALDELLAQRSRQCLEQVGEAAWSAAGGIRGPDGRLTCAPTSALAAQVVREAAADPGGLLWADAKGTVWAIRLVPVADPDPASYFGFALSWGGNGALLDPEAGAKNRKSRKKNRMDEARSRLKLHALRLRLAARAGQLLATIHLSVTAQRRSVVLLPDVLLGQIVWGGDRGDWPQDWRRDVTQTLLSLTDLRAEVFRLSAAGWRPQFGAHSVAIAHVEQLWVTRPADDCCRPSCALWNSATPHRHLLVQVGYGFLGALQKFATGAGANCHTYDFTKTPADEIGEEVDAARKAGQMISVSAPAALFGLSKWSGLSDAHVRVIQVLVGEVTRVPPPHKTSRADKAQVFSGSRVVGRTAREKVSCPLLLLKRHVAFCGNGHRRGMGYLIVGSNGRGWLDKCGYVVPDDDMGLVRVIREFLMDLGKVREILGLTVVGLEPKGMQWFRGQDLLALPRSRCGLQQLLAVHLRVYGPEDYHRRCRSYLACRGRFSLLPGGDDSEDHEQLEPAVALDLAAQIRRAGIRQAALAKYLGVSQPFVSQLMNRDRPWPESARQKAEALLAERMESVDFEVGVA